MPLFEYRCEHCGDRFEIIKRATDKDEVRCKKCGEKAQKLLSGFAVRSGASSGAATNSRIGSCAPWGGG